jgi:hypothetical protein
MPQFRDSIEIARPPEDVWRAIGMPERWFEGYLETRSRSEGYPGPESRDDHVYRTRAGMRRSRRSGPRPRVGSRPGSIDRAATGGLRRGLRPSLS